MKGVNVNVIPISRPSFSIQERVAVIDVMATDQLAQGPQVAAFEQEWAQVCRAKHCVAVANGTLALTLMLEAMRFRPNGEVITSPFTFWGTIEAIMHAGLVPVFADIDPDTYNIDPLQVRELITDKTVAILPIHLYGLQAEMEMLQLIADRNYITLLEDSCQGHGLPLAGDAAAFSFYATKNITTLGEGGAIVTNNAELAERLRHLRNHCNAGGYTHSFIGYNARMTEAQAAVGRVQIAKLERFNAARTANAAYYNEHLSVGIKPEGGPHVWHQYTLRVNHRQDFCEYLDEYGIGYGIYYPTPCHKQPLFEGNRTLPIAEYLAEHVVSIPVHPLVTDMEREYIVNTINSWGKEHEGCAF